MTLAARHEVALLWSMGSDIGPWALAARPGQAQIAALREALDDFRSTWRGVRWPYYLSLLAEATTRQDNQTQD